MYVTLTATQREGAYAYSWFYVIRDFAVNTIDMVFFILLHDGGRSGYYEWGDMFVWEIYRENVGGLARVTEADSVAKICMYVWLMTKLEGKKEGDFKVSEN